MKLNDALCLLSEELENNTVIDTDEKFYQAAEENGGVKKALTNEITVQWKQVENPETIQTLEGPQTAQPGAVIVTRIENGQPKESWSISKKEKFLSKYNDNGDGTATKKGGTSIEYFKTNKPYKVKIYTSEPLLAEVGTVIIRYGSNDFGVIQTNHPKFGNLFAGFYSPMTSEEYINEWEPRFGMILKRASRSSTPNEEIRYLSKTLDSLLKGSKGMKITHSQWIERAIDFLVAVKAYLENRKERRMSGNELKEKVSNLLDKLGRSYGDVEENTLTPTLLDIKAYFDKAIEYMIMSDER